MNTYNVFNCQFKAVQLSLGRECCLSGREALAEVMEPLLEKPRTIEEFHGVDNIWELYKKKKKVPDFRDAIAIKYRAQGEDIIERLHKMIDGCITPMDAILVLTNVDGTL